MAVNEVLNTRRRAYARREVARAEMLDSAGADAGDAVLDHDEVWQAVLLLPPRQRAVLALRYYEDLSEQQIAEALGCRPGTVKSQASAALATLRARLADQTPAGETRS